MEIRNVTSRALEIAATGQHVEPGETVDVEDNAVAKALLQQEDVWQSDTKTRRAKAGDDTKEQ